MVPRGAGTGKFLEGEREQEAGLSLETIRAMGLVGWIHMPIPTTFYRERVGKRDICVTAPLGGGLRVKSRAGNDLCIRSKEYPSPTIFYVC